MREAFVDDAFIAFARKPQGKMNISKHYAASTMLEKIKYQFPLIVVGIVVAIIVYYNFPVLPESNNVGLKLPKVDPDGDGQFGISADTAKNIQKEKAICQRTVLGKIYVVDDRGQVCTWKDGIDSSTGCCKEQILMTPSIHIIPKYSCMNCNITANCCSVYEFCVSCCMEPKKYTYLRTQFENSILVAPGSPGQPSSILQNAQSPFEYCQAVCRTSSKSLQFQNKYRNDLKYCYGMEAPPIKAAFHTENKTVELTLPERPQTEETDLTKQSDIEHVVMASEENPKPTKEEIEKILKEMEEFYVDEEESVELVTGEEETGKKDAKPITTYSGKPKVDFNNFELTTAMVTGDAVPMMVNGEAARIDVPQEDPISSNKFSIAFGSRQTSQSTRLFMSYGLLLLISYVLVFSM